MPLPIGALAASVPTILQPTTVQPATVQPATLAPAALSNRELLLAGGVVLAILYLAISAVRGGPSRDRKGRFRSKRRGQFLGLLKIGVVVGLLWLTTAMVGIT